MATPFPPSRQALELADRLIDGQLTDVELQRLNRQLESNPALRHYLLDMCQFHALLTFDTRAKRLIDEVVATHGTERSLETVPPGEAVVSASSVPRTWPRFGFFSRGATGAVAAALLVALSTLVTLQLMQPHVDRGPIVATNDGASQSLPEVTAIKIGPQTTELELARIGSVILEGPTDFELVGPMRARLTKGKIRFRVTDKHGRGFVVDTPYGEITDLGTEFGVDVQEQEPTSLVVFDGEVDLRV